MTFDRALAQLLDGLRITRTGWPAGQRLRIVRSVRELYPDPADAGLAPPDLSFPTVVVEQVDRSGNATGHYGWTPCSADMFGTDWKVLP